MSGTRPRLYDLDDLLESGWGEGRAIMTSGGKTDVSFEKAPQSST